MDAHPCTAPAVQQIPTALPMCRCSVLIDTTYRSGQNRRAATKKSPKKTCVSEIENFLSQKEFVCLRCLRFRVLRKEFVCLGFRWSQKKFVCLGFRVQKKFVCLGLLAKKVCVSGISRVKKSSCVWDFCEKSLCVWDLGKKSSCVWDFVGKKSSCVWDFVWDFCVIW
jgi:hypothetical protein